MSVDHRDPPEAGPAQDNPGGDRPQQPRLNRLVASFVAPALCLSDEDGQIRPGGAGGVFVEDRRLLSELVLEVDGAEPSPLSYELGGGAENRFEAACFNLGTAAPDPTVVVTRRRRVRPDGLDEQYVLRSYDRAPLSLVVGLRMAADLAEMADVKSGGRPDCLAATGGAGSLQWSDEHRGTIVATASPAPTSVDGEEGSLSWSVELAAGAQATLELRLRLVDAGTAGQIVCSAPPRNGTTGPVVEAQDRRLSLFLQRSVADLEALRLVTVDRPGDVFLAAGVPWFLTLFGRDSIWAARMLLPFGTDLALGTLRTLAHRQGRNDDLATGEEPGKMLHELRRSPSRHDLWQHDGSALRLPPAYYGTVDATLLWVLLLHDAWRYGADEGQVRQLLGPMHSCLEWLSASLARRGGFVSYVDESGHGLQNQGWKDSHDGIQFRDGRIATAPLALCEVQGYAYEAAVAGAALLDAFDRPGSAQLLELADGLATRFRSRYWVEDAEGHYPAVALDAEGVPVDSLASNIGHLLGTGLLNPDEETLVARRLAGPDLDSGFGLRTLAASSTGFNPLSYHAGSVWAHDTAIALAGLSRSGGDVAQAAAASYIDGLLSAAERFEHRMPELYAGHQRDQLQLLDPYPASCRPQAWSAATSAVIVTSLLGLRPDIPAGVVHLAPLDCPVGLRSVGGIRLGQAPVSFRLGEHGGVEAAGLPGGTKLVVRD
jgi:hypothetical protein